MTATHHTESLYARDDASVEDRAYRKSASGARGLTPHVPAFAYLVAAHDFRARHREMQMAAQEFRNWRRIRTRALRNEARLDS